MVKIERFEDYSIMVEEFEGMKFIINLPVYWKIDEDSMKNEKWNLPVRLLEKVVALIKEGRLRAEEGEIFEKEDGEMLVYATKLTGFILLKPVLQGIDGNSLQIIPLYKEEISFARRMGWRRLRNMFKYLTPEELNFISPDRYNIITDIDGRKNCF
ncbi:MAG: suppressor of fused domain protein [Catonella sp.]